MNRHQDILRPINQLWQNSNNWREAQRNQFARTEEPDIRHDLHDIRENPPPHFKPGSLMRAQDRLRERFGRKRSPKNSQATSKYRSMTAQENGKSHKG